MYCIINIGFTSLLQQPFPFFLSGREENWLLLFYFHFAFRLSDYFLSYIVWSRCIM